MQRLPLSGTRATGQSTLAPAFLCLGLLLSAGLVRGQGSSPGYQLFYVVVTLQDEGPTKLVHASAPIVRHQLESLPLSVFEAGRPDVLARDEHVAVTLLGASGLPLFHRFYPVMRAVHGEFHGTPAERGGWSIQAYQFDVAEKLAVVRVPAAPDSRLLIESRTGSLVLDSAELSGPPQLADDILTSRSNSLSALQASAQSTTDDNRVDLLIMGDGYTQAQASKFFSDADFFEQSMLSITPYSEYANYLRVTKLFVASQQSGADHPPYDPSCVGDDPSCCADPEAQNDSLAGTFVNTALGSRYCAFNIHRLLVPDTSAVLQAASAAATWDQIVVLVNDETYGGSGNPGLRISTSSLNSAAVDVVRHEYGHSFTDLADEYDDPNPGFPACSDVSGTQPCEANVTDETSPSLIKWSPWIPGSVPIPTPEGQAEYQDVVGLFEGARYLASDMYRPRDQDCLMHFLGKPFGEICRQEYVLRLYSGGWGVAPLSGIRMIEPGSAEPKVSSFRRCSGSLDFSIAVLQPVGGPAASIQWFEDGTPISGATAPNFTHVSTAPASTQLAVRVTDTTVFVHPDMENGELTTEHLWTFDTVSLPNTLTLENQNVTQTETHEACDTITAGPSFVVLNGGDLTLQAGNGVVLKDGFRVESGGSLTVIVDPVFPP